MRTLAGWVGLLGLVSTLGCDAAESKSAAATGDASLSDDVSIEALCVSACPAIRRSGCYPRPESCERYCSQSARLLREERTTCSERYEARARCMYSQTSFTCFQGIAVTIPEVCQMEPPGGSNCYPLDAGPPPDTDAIPRDAGLLTECGRACPRIVAAGCFTESQCNAWCREASNAAANAPQCQSALDAYQACLYAQTIYTCGTNGPAVPAACTTQSEALAQCLTNGS